MRVVCMGLALVVPACGGNVTAGGGEQQAASAGGAMATAAVVTASGTSVASSVASTASAGGSEPTPECQQACAMIEPCGNVEGCVPKCSQVAAGCEALHAEFLRCYLGSTDPCLLPPECVSPMLFWLDCEGRLGGNAFGASGRTACQWTELMGPMKEHAVTVDCLASSGGSSCQCLVDNALVATCDTSTPALEACNPFEECCAAVFFVPF